MNKNRTIIYRRDRSFHVENYPSASFYITYLTPTNLVPSETLRRWPTRFIINEHYFCHVLTVILHKNCLLQHVFEWKIEIRIDVTERRGKRRKQLLGELKAKKGYWTLKEEELDRTVLWTCCGRGYGPVIRETERWKNSDSTKNYYILLKNDRHVKGRVIFIDCYSYKFQSYTAVMFVKCLASSYLYISV